MGSSWSEVFLTFQATHSRTSLPHTNINFFPWFLLTCATDCMPTRMLVVFKWVISPTIVSQMSLVSLQMCRSQFTKFRSQFANVTSIYMCRSQFAHFVDLRCQHWAYKLTLWLRSYSFVVDFALSQHLHVACTVAVTHKSIYQWIWNRSYCCCVLSGSFALWRKVHNYQDTG